MPGNYRPDTWDTCSRHLGITVLMIGTIQKVKHPEFPASLSIYESSALKLPLNPQQSTKHLSWPLMTPLTPLTPHNSFNS